MTTEIMTRPTGRPLKLTPKVIKTLMGFIARGNYFSTAAYAAGISDETLVNWLKQGAEDYKNNRKGLFFGLFVALKRAEAKAETARVARIEQAGIGGQVSRRVTRTKRDGTEETEETFQLPQWLADITFLERRHPDRWGRKDRTRIDINETKEITITHVDYNLAQTVPGQVIDGQVTELGERGNHA